MSGVRVLVGTRKGAFVLTADGRRKQWDVSGPHFAGWEIYHLKGSPADPNRLEYDINTRTSVLAFVQYDNENERVDFNVRFHWIPVIGDDVYVVWNSGFTTFPGASYAFPSSRSLTHPLNEAVVIKAVHRLTP